MTDSHATSFVAGNWVVGTGEPSRAVAPRSGRHVGPVFCDVSPQQIRNAAEAAVEAAPALADEVSINIGGIGRLTNVVELLKVGQ